MSAQFTCKLPFLQILTNKELKIAKKELSQMKEWCLKQAELRNQKNRGEKKRIRNMTSYLGLRNSGMRLTLFPGSIPTSINQFLLESRLVKLKYFA